MSLDRINLTKQMDLSYNKRWTEALSSNSLSAYHPINCQQLVLSPQNSYYPLQIVIIRSLSCSKERLILSPNPNSKHQSPWLFQCPGEHYF